MSITRNDKVFKISDTEYGYALKKFRPVTTGKTVEVLIPALTGTLASHKPKALKTKGLFANSKKCKVKAAKKVKRAKAVTVKVGTRCSWLGKIDKKGFVKKDTELLVEFNNGDINSAEITTR